MEHNPSAKSTSSFMALVQVNVGDDDRCGDHCGWTVEETRQDVWEYTCHKFCAPLLCPDGCDPPVRCPACVRAELGAERQNG